MSFRKNKQKSERTYRGQEYKSPFEVDIRKGLSRVKRKLRAKFKISYESEKIPYVLERNYIPDFVIERPDGTKLYVEAKGYFDRQAMAKMKAVIEQNPDLEIVFIFYRDNPIRKGSKTRYSDWCTKQGVDFAINEIPERWFKPND